LGTADLKRILGHGVGGQKELGKGENPKCFIIVVTIEQPKPELKNSWKR